MDFLAEKKSVVKAVEVVESAKVTESQGDTTASPVSFKDTDMSDSISAGVPALIPVAGHSHSGHSGFTPSDAALVRASATSSESRSNLIETSASAKDNLVQTLETKFQVERSVKETELAVERSARAHDRELNTVRKELADLITGENQKTRELLVAQQAAGLAAQLADSKQSAQMAALLRAIKYPADI